MSIHNEVVRLYIKENKSTIDIAKELNLSISKVRRILVKNGITLRSHSNAQSLAIETGKVEHPTKGRKRSEGTRKKIARKQHEFWEDMPEKEKERRSRMSKEQYEKLTLSERDELQERRHEGIRRAAKEGSKMEKFVEKSLLQAGYVVQYHRNHFLPNLALEVDLLIPEIKTAIEIDGPSHFLPIWGELSLQRNIKSDAEKAGLLLNAGFCLIRVKCLYKNISNFLLEETAKKILVELDKIKENFPDRSKRFIEIEV